MALPNVFDAKVAQGLIERIQKLSPDLKPLWGKMNCGQMLAHCNVTYGYVFEPDKFKPAPAMIKLILKWFVKKLVVNEAPYKQGLGTGPDFKVSPVQNFDLEKGRLIAFIEKTQKAGPGWFEGRQSHSFGKLTAYEWNNMFYKHIDHHLRQFGV